MGQNVENLHIEGHTYTHSLITYNTLRKLYIAYIHVIIARLYLIGRTYALHAQRAQGQPPKYQAKKVLRQKATRKATDLGRATASHNRWTNVPSIKKVHHVYFRGGPLP